MSLYKQLQQRGADQQPIRIGVIGAGKFGTMFLGQAIRLPGVHVVGIADLSVDQAKSNLKLAGWRDDQLSASSLEQAVVDRTTYVGDDSEALITHPAVEIIVECTGDPLVAIDHLTRAFECGETCDQRHRGSGRRLWCRVNPPGPTKRSDLFHGLWGPACHGV